MLNIKNWDNNTWISSTKYIKSFNNFLVKQKKLTKHSKILDIGCGRGKIMGLLSSKLKLINKPIGLDIENHKDFDKRIIFKKTNQKKESQVKVKPSIVLDTRLCSTIGNNDFQISTVEHLMSALCASGIDNITIEVSGSEIPIMDGSAIAFIHLIKSAGIVDQQAPKEFIRIKKTIEARQEDP